MQLRYLKNVLPAGDSIQKVTSLTWSANNGKLAAVTTDKVVYLFDENGERKDKFKTKAADPSGPSTYIVRSMAFSPDSTKLAIAQSDNIVFVYRLGESWTEKKSICNKFPQQVSITCLVWPKDRPNEIVFGLADGKVKLGDLIKNKPYTMYTHPDGSYVVSLAASPNGLSVVSGHLDGAVFKYTFPTEDGGAGMGHTQITVHPCVPYALSWGGCIGAAGNDSKVVFYDTSGREIQSYDYSADESVREFSSCAFNPAGDTAVFGCYNRFYVYCHNLQRASWDEICVKQIDNFYSVSALAWKPDGSKLVVGGMTGAVDVYDACVRRHGYKGKFEFTYVSKSSVIVKTLKTGMRIVLKSVYGYEIDRINIYQDRFLIARTATTLLMGNLDSCKLSEVPWGAGAAEKFHFENERACIVHCAGELHIVEYGRNEVLGTVRTEHMDPHLISVVVVEARGIARESKKLAYLVDLHTVRIQDLVHSVQTVATVNHDTRIDWLELNQRGTHLLFRDKKRHLHLYDISKQERTTLLNYCQYVQWVPGGDVVVAQSRNNLCVWYSVNTPDRVTMVPIKGEVVDIERAAHRTEVIVDEGINTVSYALDESLIYFGAALEDQDFEHAAEILEPLELTPETEAQWMQLAELALQNNQVVIAERCYAALGDIAKTRFLHKIVKAATKAAAEVGGDGYESFAVRSQLAQLGKQWHVAESLLLAQGKVNEAIQMYQDAQRWEDAIRVAEGSHHPDTEGIKSRYYKYLLESGQEEKAGAVKEREEDWMGAISLYLKGGLPARAAQVVMGVNLSWDNALLDSILSALAKAGLYERAGELLEHLGRSPEALTSFRRGHAYRKAIDLARREFQGSVIQIEEEWGDWLMGQKQMDGAINHFIEAGQSLKAIEAAIGCRQFAKAAGIIEYLEPGKALPYYKRIAQHYESTRHLEEAERYYIKADMAMDAVDMYSRAGKWDAAQKVARGYLTDAEMRAFYRKKAREFESTHKWKEAEKAYIQAEEQDLAIAMYKKAKQFEHMLRLVQTYRKEQLTQAQLLVAQALESEGLLREAEKHYGDAKDWKSAVQMYRTQGMWEDSLRVAKVYGGAAASKQVAYAWAITLGGEEGATLLKKLGLLDQAIDYAVESGAFAQAFELTRAGLKTKLPEVHLKYAMFLEDEGRFQEAEAEFIAASKPKEAVDMYVHGLDWDAAMRIAEQYDPTCIADILIAQARAAVERKAWQMAEGLFLKAKRPDLCLKMYRDAKMWHDALRIAEDYLPGKVQEIHLELASAASNSSSSAPAGADSVVAKAKAFERNNDYARAIEAYLSLTKNDTANFDSLEQCWEQAASLAINYQRHRMHDVVNTVSARLVDIQRFQAAAELHEGIDDVQGAIRAYCQGALFDKARVLAGSNPTLTKYIDEQYNTYLVSNNQAEALAARGGAQAQVAIEMYAQRDDWVKVHELAALQGPEASALYAVRHAERRFKQGEYAEAATVFAQHGISNNAAYFELYRAIALAVLSAPQVERRPEAERSLRDMLLRLVTLLGGSTTRKGELEDFRKLYLAAHYIATAHSAEEKGLHDLAARDLTSALRYVGIIPADRAFYEAGVAWRKAGKLSMSFVMLNRYLDLTDAMDEPDSSNASIENADFANTDIPYDFVIPQRSYVSDDEREEVRNLVLEISMDRAVEQALDTRTCESCGGQTYEANLVCHNHSCKHRSEACVVTGYPVPSHERVVSKANGTEVVAIRDHWNTWVQAFSTCPVTGGAAMPMY
ncbi:MAG: hypothetical protein WDW38_002966 [Sanguina aurantia]